MTPRELDPFVPDERAKFIEQARLDKARRMLAVIDSACTIVDMPIPRGEKGVEWFLGLHAVCLLEIRWKAKLDRPPSPHTIVELCGLIRGR